MSTAMDVKAFDKLRKIVYQQSGIDIKDGKMSMIASRIGKRLRALDLESELDYVAYLERALDEEIVHLLDAVSTNVTSFFREAHHFEVVREAMDKWLAGGQKRFRFWSAACSTGEEPYTLAMTLRDAADGAGVSADMKILATDISTRVLAEAQEGKYPPKRVEAIPLAQRQRYLKRETGPRGDVCHMAPSLKQMIVYRRMNLSKPPFLMRGPMDIIFCRNVMIYFDDKVRDALLREFHRLLRPDGYLMVGHAESLTRAGDIFDRAGASVYRPIK